MEKKHNECGEIVTGCFEQIPERFPNAVLDVFVMMPNHIHGILIIINDDCRGVISPPQKEGSIEDD
jgi:REP element-mobilizing transposase RayT